MLKSDIRMLASIMFTDMVGYTKLMQEDETLAITLRNRHRKILENAVLDHKGQILQYYGDGTLVIFGSVIESVLCAIQIQIELNEEPKVPLRIGIHSGDIVYGDDGIYGDSVNIASRIESLSTPGSVLISSKVYDEIKNHKNISAVSLGNYELKNVKHPVEIFAISDEKIIVPDSKELSSKIIKEESVAVLPFVNMSADPENEYFSDGMTEEILNALAKVEGLLVTSRTSSFAFKGKQTDIREIGKQLGVKTLLEGSVRKAGSRVRITAQLIEAETGYHRWSEVYDRSLEDIFSVQDEIASTIAGKLRDTFADKRRTKPLVKSPTDNMDAYNLYLKGVHFWNKWTPPDVRKSLDFLKKATELDPGFALAYSALSACHIYLGALGQMSSDLAYSNGSEYALKAIELDNNLPDSHLSLAMVHFFEWNWEDSGRCFMKALELNPNHAEAHRYFAMYLMITESPRTALEEIEKAAELDPLSIPIRSALGDVYLNAGMYDDAMREYERTLELDPTFRAAMNGLGWTYFLMGENEKSIEIFKKVQKLTGNELKAVSFLGYVFAKSGEEDKARECLDKLKKRSKEEKDISLHMDFAVIHTGLEEYDKAFEYLEEAYEDRVGGLVFLRMRAWKDIHNDPRYKDLIRRMNLTVYEPEPI